MASLGGLPLKQRHPTSLRDEPPSTNPQDLDTLSSSPPLLANIKTKHPSRLHISNSGPSDKTQRLGKRSFRYPRSVLGACVLYLGFLVSLLALAFQLHYALPAPVSSADGALVIDPSTGQRQFSEENVRTIVRHLSEDIGYRIVGTEQDQETQLYLLNEIHALKVQAESESARRSRTVIPEGHKELYGAFPKFEVWVQKDDGAHQFDFMSKVVMKTYANMTNIIVRLSCGSRCDENAILLNAHYDTTLGSPGAVDDALPIGVMVELIRILSQRTALKRNSLIFLFNGGEESLQDASHSFINNHPLRQNVKAVINLEGCGTTGPEILFQANSLPMIKAYSQVPYPHATVLANDLFATGVLLSDTDYRIFVQENLTGLDLAVYKNSYLYHTHLDLERNMEQGLPQHLGENTLALAIHAGDNVDISQLEPTSSVVFFDILGQFFVFYSLDTAVQSHIAIGALVAFTIAVGACRPTFRSAASVSLSLVAALLTPNFTAFFLQSVGRPMLWFSHEWLPIVIFGPLGVASMLAIQWLLHDTKISNGENELRTLSGITVLYTLLMAAASLARIASSYFLAMYAFCGSISLVFNHRRITRTHGGVSSVDYLTYFVASGVQTLYGAYLGFSLFDLIVPLTGRIGVTTPVDNVMAIVTGFSVFFVCPPLLAFSHRFGVLVLKKIIIGFLVAQVAVVLVGLVVLSPYDTMHPKRVFIQHLRNTTSGESLLYVAHADPGPFYELYVRELEAMYETKATFRSGLDNPGDWNSIYPFSQFLDSYVLDTSPYIRRYTSNATLSQSSEPLTSLIHDAPKLIAENVSYDAKSRIRKLSIICTHPNYIWTVTSFDAEVVSWSMNVDIPSKDHFHYVIRNAGGYRGEGWRLDLEYRAAGPNDRLHVELTAMETEGFGRDAERELQGSGDIGIMRKLVKARPDHITLTYFSSVLGHFDL
ncbi:hypothetical protein BGZ95_004990 [Linnemannia exigua]|uniref:Peptide hydrolase n=1 Tax=Linnemannia exigua TaxID=604196 RepID=A0AAD4D2F4_9FUNG|nr:hypothetical protein BGZ95_004990 [Linnemannia exigua]